MLPQEQLQCPPIGWGRAWNSACQPMWQGWAPWYTARKELHPPAHISIFSDPFHGKFPLKIIDIIDKLQTEHQVWRGVEVLLPDKCPMSLPWKSSMDCKLNIYIHTEQSRQLWLGILFTAYLVPIFTWLIENLYLTGTVPYGCVGGWMGKWPGQSDRV